MDTEQKIREAFEKYLSSIREKHLHSYIDFKAGYLTLLNELERMGSQQVVNVRTGRNRNASLYILPEGVNRDW